MIKVTWDDKTCRHAGVCVRTLPKVFKIESGKFVIDTKAASEQEILATVAKCPSGALQVQK